MGYTNNFCCIYFTFILVFLERYYMSAINWSGLANTGFDAFGNFQGGWDVGSPTGNAYESFTNILNLAGQLAPTLGPAGAAFGIGLNQAAATNNTVSAIDKYNNGTIQPSDILQITGSVLGGLTAASLLLGGSVPIGIAATIAAIGLAGGPFARDAVNQAIRALMERIGSGDPSPIADIKKKFDQASTIPSPIILDLDGDGVETIAVTAGAYFDHAADGFAEQTAWVGKDDGLLVRDLNGNNTIDSGRELFGSETLLANGQKAANGFAAMAELDSNLDGKLDASDADFASLRVWKDTNGNGQTDAGELLSLSDAGVQSIAVGYTTSTLVDANNNQHRQMGSFTTVGGQTRAAEDVWVQADTTYSIATTRLDVPADVAALPDIAGFGKVYDLHQAMVRDASGTLKSLVTQFTQAATITEREALLQSIIYKWTGVENIDPASRAATQIYGNAIGDARKLEALEEFMGQEWFGVWCWGTHDPNPHGKAAPVLLQAYAELSEMIYSELASQSFLKPLYDKISLKLDATNNTFTFSLDSVAIDIAAAITSNRTGAIQSDVS